MASVPSRSTSSWSAVILSVPGLWLITQKRRAQSIPQAPEQAGQFHHAGSVQRRERFVRDNQGRPAGERLGDGRALPFPARKFVWIGGQHTLRQSDSRQFQQFGRVALRMVGPQDLTDLASDAQHRVERQQRILEDYRDLRAAHGFQRPLVERQQIASAQQHLPAQPGSGRARAV